MRTNKLIFIVFLLIFATLNLYSFSSNLATNCNKNYLKHFASENSYEKPYANFIENSSLNISDEEINDISYFVQASSYSELGNYNGSFEFTWIMGPGKITLSSDTDSGFIGIGTDLGILILNSSGSRVLSKYLGFSVPKVLLDDINQDNDLDVLFYVSNDSLIGLEFDGKRVFKAYVDFPVLSIDFKPFFSSLEKNIIVVSEHYVKVYSKDATLLLNQYISDTVTSSAIYDVNNDGLYEVVMGTVNGQILIVSKDTISSMFADQKITSLACSDINSDSIIEIFAGTSGGKLYIFSSNGELLKTIDISPNLITASIICDADADGSEEIIVSDKTGFLVIMNKTYETEISYNFSIYVKSILSGQFVTGSERELLLVSEDVLKCIQFNGTSLVTIWSYTTAFSLYTAEVFDVDSDNFSEVLYGGRSEKLMLLESDSSESRSIIYTIYAYLVCTGDVDGDGLGEFITINNENKIFYLDDNGDIIWNLNLDTRVLRIVLSDINFDNKLEILLLCKNGNVICLDVNGDLVFNYDSGASLNDITIADFDFDGNKEIGIATSNGLHILNSTGYPIRTRFTGSNITAITSGNITGDSRLEIYLGLNDGSIIIYKFTEDTYKTLSLATDTILQIQSQDIDKDSYDEAIIAVKNGSVFAISYTEILWAYHNIGFPPQELLISSANSLIIVSHRNGLIALNYSGDAVWKRNVVNGVSFVDIEDINGDLQDELVVITIQGDLYILDKDGHVKWDFSLTEANFSSLSIYDVDHNIVSDCFIGGSKGLLLLETVPELWILSPANNSELNSRELEILWNFCGIVPSWFELFLDSTQIDIIYGVNTSYSLILPSDGHWKITIQCIPKSGSLLRSSVLIYVDSTEPLIRIISPNNNTYTNSINLTVTWTGDDNESGIDHYEIRCDNKDWIDVGLSNSYTFTNLSYGFHKIKVKAVDALNNQNISSIVIVVDNIAPSIQITYPINESFINSSSLWIRWNYTEENLDRFELYIDAQLYYNGSATSFFAENLTDGDHSIRLICWDKARNFFEETIKIVIDTSSPQIEIIQPKNSSIINENKIILKLTFSDDNFDKIYIKINESSWTDYGTNTSIEIELDKEGFYIISVKAVDKAGNKNETKIILTIDTTPPSINIILPTNHSYINSSFLELIWNGTDTLSGIHYYEIKIDGAAWINIGYTTSFYVHGLNDGAHTIHVRAVDHAGNHNVSTVIFYIDTKKPTIKVISPVNNTITNSSTIEIIFTYTDASQVLFDIYLNDTLLFSTNETKIVILLDTEGYYDIRITGYDLAGNTIQVHVYLTYDAIPPVVFLLNDLNNTEFRNSSFKLRWKGYDNISGIVGYYISIDFGDFMYLGLSEEYVIDLTELSLGKHIILLKANDAAGNTRVIKIVFYKVREEIRKPPLPTTVIIISLSIISIIAFIDIYIFLIRKRMLPRT